MMKTFQNIINYFIFFLFTIGLYEPSYCEPIRGVTIRNWPYANRLENGQFEGFVVDLLNEISRLAKITYTLQLSNQTEYGGWTKNGTVTGLIGEVYRKEADFAIGDITVLSTRDRYVEFSSPFMKFGLTALIHKNNIGNITSFKDLSEQSDIEYGVKKYGANLPLFHDSPVITKMYNYMDANPSSFSKGEKEGIRRAKTTKYAFITEGPFNEYVVNRDCDLTVIDDKQKHFQFEYAIAMRNDLIQRHEISSAIRKMKKSGLLDQLKDKYWKTDKCLEDTNVHEIDPKTSAQLSNDPGERQDMPPVHGNHYNWNGNRHRHKRGKHRNNSCFNCLSKFLVFPIIIISVLLFR